LEIKNALVATEYIISELEKRNLEDKILLLKLSGKLEKGKLSSINFHEIENFVKSKKAYALLKSTSQIITEEPAFEVEASDMNKIEDTIIQNYTKEKPSSFTKFITSLINSLALEKQEDEKASTFEERLLSEARKILELT